MRTYLRRTARSKSRRAAYPTGPSFLPEGMREAPFAPSENSGLISRWPVVLPELLEPGRTESVLPKPGLTEFVLTAPDLIEPGLTEPGLTEPVLPAVGLTGYGRARCPVPWSGSR